MGTRGIDSQEKVDEQNTPLLTTSDLKKIREDALLTKSKDELVKYIVELENSTRPAPIGELNKKRPSSRTEKLTPRAASAFFGPNTGTEVTEYVPLPANHPLRAGRQPGPAWKIKLIFPDASYQPLGIELLDDVQIGRMSRDSTPDLDLTVQGAARGVSRKHALLHPTEDNLTLLDLDSFNGTYHNGVRLTPSKGQKLKDNDTISFGQLHVMIKIVQSPAQDG